MPSTKHLLTGLTAAAALALPAAAQADSIVYIDHGNVWSASPDGVRKVQLTDGGDWHSPTQSDDGTIAAVKGTGGISVLARDGRPLHTITTAMTKSPDGSRFQPQPKALSYSPDGSKIAYSYIQFACTEGSTCGSTPERATYVTDAGGDTASPVEKYGDNTGVSDAEWLSPSRLLMAGGFLTGVAFYDMPGEHQGRVPWVGDKAELDVGDPEISRDGKHFAMTVDYGPRKIIGFYLTHGDPRTDTPPEQPEPACNTNPDEKNADPTWSPDGMAVAWQNADGVNVHRFSKIDVDRCEHVSDLVLAAGGSEPDWGPADPPVKRYAGPDPKPSPTPTPTVTPDRATPRLAIATTAATRRSLRKGLRVRATAATAGTVTAKLTLRGRTIARGRATAPAAGTVAIRLGKVRHPKAGKVKLVVSQAGAVSVSRTLKVR